MPDHTAWPPAEPPTAEQTRSDGTSDSVGAALAAARAYTLRLVDGLDHDDLHRPLHPVMSPLVWDLGHIAAYEDLWLAHRHAGQPLLRPQLSTTYDAFETPRPLRPTRRLLDYDEARDFMAAVRERTLANLVAHGADPLLHEMVLRHELQHTETMLQAMRLGGLPLPGIAPPGPVDGTGLELVEVPGGGFAMGSPDSGFAYDNERPRHPVDVGAYRIGRTPVTNASWLTFTEGGGYERREWWSDEGWAWKEDQDITHCPSAEHGHPDAPVCHVAWFEADAFARAHGLRLPTEAEWERAATWDHTTRLHGVGAAWEWTASEFSGYPRFVATPYREYSAVFFDRGYRVLRGWSYATHPHVASPRFRNWDLPERRQLFAGVRLAGDAR